MKISVGICTHNGEKFIAEQLESIIGQSVTPDEIILTDDASKDKTVEISRMILENSNIYHQVISYDSHQGILKNFSNCLGMCTGDVIFSCDQDDIWMPNKIEKFISHFEQGCSFVYSNARVVDINRNILEENFWACYGIDFKKISTREFSSVLLRNCCIAGCNMAFTKELYDKVKPIPFHYLHDGWLAICAPWFGKIAFIDEPLIEYRRHGKNVSGFQVEDKKNEKSKKTKRIIDDSYKKALPDIWFGNHHYYETSRIFYDRMRFQISEEYASEVISCIRFNEALLKCLPAHRIKSIFILVREYINGNYRLFRGNWKRLVKDILYLCINENTSFEHDLKKW